MSSKSKKNRNLLIVIGLLVLFAIYTYVSNWIQDANTIKAATIQSTGKASSPDLLLGRKSNAPAVASTPEVAPTPIRPLFPESTPAPTSTPSPTPTPLPTPSPTATPVAHEPARPLSFPNPIATPPASPIAPTCEPPKPKFSMHIRYQNFLFRIALASNFDPRASFLSKFRGKGRETSVDTDTNANDCKSGICYLISSELLASRPNETTRDLTCQNWFLVTDQASPNCEFVADPQVLLLQKDAGSLCVIGEVMEVREFPKPKSTALGKSTSVVYFTERKLLAAPKKAAPVETQECLSDDEDCLAPPGDEAATDF